jgi:phosphoribosylaminoimidazole-succinocarboxamide synthase
MEYGANGALLGTYLPGIKLVNRGKVRDIYDLGDALLFVATDRPYIDGVRALFKRRARKR